MDLLPHFPFQKNKANKATLIPLSSQSAPVLTRPPQQVLYTLIYILPFYLHPATRPSPTTLRSSPPSLRTRIRLALLSTTLCTTLTYLILHSHLHLSLARITTLLGLLPPTPTSLLTPLLPTLLLFAGPLVEKLLTRPLPTISSLKNLPRGVLSVLWPQTQEELVANRNYITAPLTEEVLFRANLLALHLCTQPPPLNPQTPYPDRWQLVFLTPLYFALAHLHHLLSTRLTYPHAPILPIVIQTVVQVAYTGVFGWYASFLYLRSGGVWGVVAVHAFCNFMGLPRVWGRLERWEGGGRGSRDGREGKERGGNEDEEGDEGDEGWGWREVVYYAALLGGVWGWWWGGGVWWLSEGRGGFS